LICPGIPGAGKTVMSSIVIHFLNTRFRKDADVKVAFLFCSYQSQHVQKSDDLLSSLLRQLAYRNSGKLCSHVEDLYKERLAADWTALDHEKMTSALSHTARSYKKIFIVVDSLDEHLPSNPEERRQLLSELFKLQNDLPVSFALCF
jgi:KaiC/GvpD/RAD55 family RecA-like ATPase